MDEKSEAVASVWKRILRIEPEHVFKILGLFLLIDDDFIVRLATCPDDSFQDYILRARIILSLPPPSQAANLGPNLPPVNAPVSNIPLRTTLFSTENFGPHLPPVNAERPISHHDRFNPYFQPSQRLFSSLPASQASVPSRVPQLANLPTTLFPTDIFDPYLPPVNAKRPISYHDRFNPHFQPSQGLFPSLASSSRASVPSWDPQQSVLGSNLLPSGYSGSFPEIQNPNQFMNLEDQMIPVGPRNPRFFNENNNQPDSAVFSNASVSERSEHTPHRICKYFDKHGSCRDGNTCRFRHEQAPSGLIAIGPRNQMKFDEAQR